MFRALRTSPIVLLALALAAVLSVGGSLGLHPEPAAPSGASGGDATFSSTTSRADAAPHRCLACLIFGATLISPIFRAPLAGATPSAAATGRDADSHGRLSHRSLSGRSPPSRS